MSVQAAKARSLYRRFLRELPSRSPSILANPSPVQKHIRGDFSSTDSSSSKSQQSQLEAAEQHIQYLKAQRMYITLLERYNPGANMNEEERVRLTARRVGMDLPIEMQQGGDNSGKE
jgi:ATP synthase assembly factor FMC1, mitochondrial